MRFKTVDDRAFPGRAPGSRVAILVALVALPFMAVGCVHVPVYQQQRVSQPGMTFSDSLVETPRVNLLTQIESGSSVSGGAQAAGCTACR